MTYDIRFVAYAPDGDRLGVVRHVSRASCGLPFNDLSSLRLTAPLNLPGGDLLLDPVEVAVEVSNGGPWTEPANGRFLRIMWQADPSAQHPEISIEAPGYAWLLEQAGVRGPDKPHYDGDSVNGNPNRIFRNANAGTILATLVNEAKDEGSLPGLELDFSASRDSNGKAWAKALPEISYTPGLPLLSVISNLTDQGMIDWHMQGRTLRVFNASDDETSQPTVNLRLGLDVAKAPTKGDLSTLTHRVVVRGDENKTWVRENPSAARPWGKFQKVINQGSVTREATAISIAEGELRAGEREAVELTRELILERAHYLPLVDYKVGDYIFAPDGSGKRQRVRVRQVTLTKNADGRVTGNVVLNDRFAEQSVRLSRRMKGIQGGASLSGASGAVPASKAEDKRQPKPVQAGGADSFAFVGEDGRPRAVANVSWSAVTTATDGTAIDVEHYEVWAREVGVTETFHLVTQVRGTSYDHGPVDAGAELDFQIVPVAARTHLRGAPIEIHVATATDVTPPPVPSALDVSESGLGVIVVSWDGKGSRGEAMPLDFRHTVVTWQSSDDTVEHTLGTLEREGTLTLPGRPYDVPVLLRAYTVDTSGNASDPTEWISVTPRRLVEEDVAGTVIDQRLGEIEDATSDLDGKLTSARNDLDAARETLGGIPGQIEAAKGEAIDAAEADATSKANAAKQEAIEAAATDAQSKADAAKAAAEEAAQEYADGQIDAKALEVAQAAAEDAQAKADAAKAAAEQAAKGYTDEQVGAVQGELDAAKGRLEKVENETLPALDNDLSRLRNETIPALEETLGPLPEQIAEARAEIERTANLVNNTTRSGTVDRWTPSLKSSTTLAVDEVDFNGRTIKALRYGAASSSQLYSDRFPVDVTKAYEIRLWVLDPTPSASSGSQFYFGVYTYDGAGSRTTGTGVNTAGRSTGESNNYYFDSTSATTPEWKEYVAYLLPYGTDPAVAAGLGKNVRGNLILSSPDTTEALFRVLSYGNTSDQPRDYWIAHMSVTETTAEALRIAQDRASEVVEAAEAEREANYGFRYSTSVVVHGDTDKFYPVVIYGGDQYVKREILVKRGYSEQGPPDWYSPTHRGALTLRMRTNFGSWGGTRYSWEIHELEQQYSTTFGGARNVAANQGFAIMLRGGGEGGAIYHLYSDQPLTGHHSTTDQSFPAIYYNGETVYNRGDTESDYFWQMPEPRLHPLEEQWVEEIRVRNIIPLAQETGEAVVTLQDSLAEARTALDAVRDETLPALRGDLDTLQNETIPELEEVVGPLPEAIQKAQADATNAATAASTAQQAAEAAAADAESKAAAAESAARAHADAQAAAAEAAAIAAASGDAEAKAAAAQAAAIEAAAEDALAKANAAQQAAEAKAKTAQDAADAAQRDANALKERASELEDSVGTLQADLANAQGALNTVRNVTLPGLNDRLETTEFSLANFSAEMIVAGELGADRIAVNELSVALADVLKLNAGAITTGELGAERINVSELSVAMASVLKLDAGAITTGELGANRIAVNELAVEMADVLELNAGRITTGELGADRIKVNELSVALAEVLVLDAGRITTGELGAERIAVNELAVEMADVLELDAGRIRTGRLSADRIAVAELAVEMANVIRLNASVIDSGTINTARLNVDALAVELANVMTLNAERLTVTDQSVVNEQVANAIWAAKISSQKILAHEVIIGGSPNLVTDATFGEGWTGAFTAGTSGRWGGPSLRLGAGQSAHLGVEDPDFRIAVEPGRQYRFTAQVRPDSGSAGVGAARVTVRGYAERGDETPALEEVTAASNPGHIPWRDWGVIEGVWTCPDDVHWVALGVGPRDGWTAIATYSDVSMQLMIDNALIVDGTIVGKKIKADEISSEHIKSNAITADHIEAGSIDATHLSADAITAKHTITGATIRTADSGYRWEMTRDEGLRAFNGAGEISLQMDVFGGLEAKRVYPMEGLDFNYWRGQGYSPLALERIRADRTNPVGISLSNGGLKITHGAGMDPDSPSSYGWGVQSLQRPIFSRGFNLFETDAELHAALPDTSSQAVKGNEAIVAPQWGETVTKYVALPDWRPLWTHHSTPPDMAGYEGGGRAYPWFTHLPTTGDLLVKGDAWIEGTLNAPNDLEVKGHIRTESTVFANAFAAESPRNTAIQVPHGLDTPHVGYPGNSVARIEFDTSGGGRTRMWTLSERTSTSAANVYSSAGGFVFRSTSARRYKDAIEPVAKGVPERLLEVEPTTWFDHVNAENYATYIERVNAFGPDPDPQELDAIEPLRRIPGLVAEDVEAAGLHEYVTYTPEGEVDGLAYDRLWTLLIPLVREQRDRIADLEARLASIECALL